MEGPTHPAPHSVAKTSVIAWCTLAARILWFRSFNKLVPTSKLNDLDALLQVLLGVAAAVGAVVIYKAVNNDDSIEGAAKDLKGDVKGKYKDAKGEAKGAYRDAKHS